MGFATDQRNACCDALLEAGPDAPTLCEGWTARDLAVHLYVREKDPATGLALLVPPLAGWGAQRSDQVKRRWAFPELVEEIRRPSGPFAIDRVNEVANTAEFFVHAEDVRRPNGGEPRPTTREFEDRIAQDLTVMAGRFVRRSPVGVALERSDTGETMRIRRGDHVVTLVGLPSELLLYLFGRTEHARVEAIGLPGDVEGLREAL